jgi:hypothetical protein
MPRYGLLAAEALQRAEQLPSSYMPALASHIGSRATASNPGFSICEGSRALASARDPRYWLVPPRGSQIDSSELERGAYGGTLRSSRVKTQPLPGRSRT